MSKLDNPVNDAIAAAQVVSARLPMLAMGLAQPTKASQDEAVRMVTEKVQANFEGMMAVQAYWMKAALGLWTRPMPTDPVGDTIDAYSAPALKTMHENAERLSGAKPKK